jgi:HD-like signal output (HDOD) protein
MPVLLVLDHPLRPLDAIALAFAGRAPDWQVLRLDNVEAARTALATRAVDVAICETRTPQFDGVEFLRHVSAASPATLRFALAGLQSDESAAAALDVAHRLLRRPVRADALWDEVQRALALRKRIGDAGARLSATALRRLPPAPRVYVRLSTALQDPHSGVDEIAAIVAEDPAIAAQVLKLCNSAFFCSARPVADLRSAVMRLGTRTIRHLALAVAVFGGPSAAERDALQQRALLASVLAPLVHGNWAESDLARTAALLADVGCLIPGVDCGIDSDPNRHAEAGAYLLALWGLPDPIVEAVAFHHDPSAASDEGFGLVGTVHVAVGLVAGCAIDERYLAERGASERMGEWRRLRRNLDAMA